MDVAMQGVELGLKADGIAAARHRHNTGRADDLGFLGKACDGENGHNPYSTRRELPLFRLR